MVLSYTIVVYGIILYIADSISAMPVVYGLLHSLFPKTVFSSVNQDLLFIIMCINNASENR